MSLFHFQLLYEFSLIANINLDILKGRAEILMNKLYNLEEQMLPASVETQLMTLISFQKELVPNKLKNKNIKAAIVCKDVSKYPFTY